jgi:quinol monooxygenase YgiN
MDWRRSHRSCPHDIRHAPATIRANGILTTADRHGMQPAVFRGASGSTLQVGSVPMLRIEVAVLERMPVRMIVSWYTPIGQAHRITIALHSMMDETRALHGCVGCSVSTRIREQGIVRYVEEWQTEEDLRQRVRSSAFSGLAALMEYASKPPRVEFALPGGNRGLDFVEEVQRSRN